MQSTITPIERARTQYLLLAARALCLILGMAAFGLVHLLGFDGWVTILGIVVPLVILACRGRGGTRGWLTLIVGITVFLIGRAWADDLGLPLHTDDLRKVEQLFFLGNVPSYVLQRWFFDPGSLSGLDYLSAVIHWSYFFVPYSVLFVIWLVRPRSTHQLAQLLILTFAVGLLIYAILPATPPWLASSEQEAPKIYRIMHFVGTSLVPETYDLIYKNVGDPNPTAALPSVHFAVTFMLFMYSLGKSKLWNILAASYCLAMAWALVYLGEHYVVDCILGGLVAWGVWYGYQRLQRASAPFHG